MQPWQPFIESQPLAGQQEAGKILLTPLPPTGVFRISGTEALEFLQGQSTCDVRQITEQKTGLGAFCNPEGRVIANFRILQEGGDYLLLLTGDLLPSVMQRLRMFILRSNVQLKAEEPALFGIAVNDSPLLVELGDLPDTPNTASRLADMTWIRMPPPGIRWLVMGSNEAAQGLWLQLKGNHHATCRTADLWQLWEIRSGIPWITQATSEAFLPQMLNLDVLGAISFDKGCYTGQEIIARTHYRGQVKRRTYRAWTPSQTQIRPGEKLQFQGTTVGQVINAAATTNGQEFLAVVRCDQAQNPAIFLASEPEAPLQWLDLAYTLS